MRIAAFCAIFLGVAIAGAPPRNAAELISRAAAFEAENVTRMKNYLFREDVTRRSFNRDRKLVRTRKTVSEVLFIEGRPAFRLVSINGRPLTEDEERAETARLRQLAEDRRRNSSVPSPAEKRRSVHPLALLLLQHEFQMAGEETTDGRDCWVVESKPRRGAPKPASAIAESIAGSTVKYWIDKETLHRVRMDVMAIKPSSAAKVREFTSYHWGQRDGTVWLVTSIQTVLPLPGSGKELAYYENEQLYSNYRRFASESNVTGVEELTAPSTP
jgi:hypothetical protein